MNRPRTKIKICGLRDPKTALAAARAGADWVGMVFVPDTLRQISVREGREIVQALRREFPQVEPVGLFADAPADLVRRTAEQVGLSVVQLHGGEPPELVAELAPLRIIKALPLREPTWVPQIIAPWRQVPAHVLAMLWDAPEAGSGRPLDWKQLAQWRAQGLFAAWPRWFLAGGLTPDNVARAIAQLHPWAVDVSSGVESSRGIKDVARIEAFVRAVQNTSKPQ